MAAVAAEAAATAASPGEGGAGEAEPEMEPIPGSEAGTDPLPVTATEASVPDGEADRQQSSPQADEPPFPPPPPPPPPPGELARSPEAAGPELQPEEKLPARVVEPAAAAPQEGPGLSPSPASPPEEPAAPEERQEPPLPQPSAPALVPPAGGDSAVSQLIPGSEVRVTLDHIIEDALVVSFRLGEKLFSGVLMDLSKRDHETYGAIALLLVGKIYSHSGEAVWAPWDPCDSISQKGI
ncbi:PWWP domain-containing protein 2A isoform X6 [Neophocaena asiaeorientalis asiaeorientalis]|uniref:PWWP domain-containing protein 2A isoform X6 n=1 Tax=Neophocaena asiaeorientalis asiaeorientalis TaxID=1706337 RepID=A0A341BW23_NEOAA|nr:PWWP domain-containing protein 2A isoform X6 [Neophocaena asiaeorientalis asiaeorientalis]